MTEYRGGTYDFLQDSTVQDLDYGITITLPQIICNLVGGFQTNRQHQTASQTEQDEHLFSTRPYNLNCVCYFICLVLRLDKDCADAFWLKIILVT